MLVRARDPGPLFARVSWNVLVFFGALFIVAAAFQRTGLVEAALEATRPYLPAERGPAIAALSGAPDGQFTVCPSNCVRRRRSTCLSRCACCGPSRIIAFWPADRFCSAGSANV